MLFFISLRRWHLTKNWYFHRRWHCGLGSSSVVSLLYESLVVVIIYLLVLIILIVFCSSVCCVWTMYEVCRMKWPKHVLGVEHAVRHVGKLLTIDKINDTKNWNGNLNGIPLPSLQPLLLPSSQLVFLTIDKSHSHPNSLAPLATTHPEGWLAWPCDDYKEKGECTSPVFIFSEFCLMEIFISNISYKMNSRMCMCASVCRLIYNICISIHTYIHTYTTIRMMINADYCFVGKYLPDKSTLTICVLFVLFYKLWNLQMWIWNIPKLHIDIRRICTNIWLRYWSFWNLRGWSKLSFIRKITIKIIQILTFYLLGRMTSVQ